MLTDGTLVREVSGPGVWQIAAGARFPVSSPEALNALASSGEVRPHVVLVPDGSLESFPLAPRTGTLLRAVASGTVHDISSGYRYSVPDLSALLRLISGGGIDPRIRTVDDAALNQIPEFVPASR